ncbi:hypothetical protein PG999_000262 [Apiospora kogelbergensis]|uniref:Uncharacterized protein n=1 Tax=Apiospora kogelbergensis TaxID=1337665 RepID=A0AAW0RBB5_9PEZI
MKFLSVKNALYLTASLGSLSRLTLAAPVAATALVTRSGINTGGSVFPIHVDIDPIDKDDDRLRRRGTQDGLKIEPRITIPKPPVPPPPPRPPVPNPVAPKPVVPKPKPVEPVPVPGPPRTPPPSPKADWKPIPPPKEASDNPGQGNGKGGDAKSMDSYANSGKTQVKNYVEITKGSRPDAITVASKKDLEGKKQNTAFLDIRKNPNYEVQEEPFQFVNVNLKELKNFKPAELGFDINALGTFTKVTVKRASDKQDINIGTYDPKGNFIYYESAFKDANTVEDKIPLNEMGMQNFKKIAGDNTKNFKAAFLGDIQNKEFWEITRQNYNDMKQPYSQVMTFEHDTAQFERYMGSPNLNSKFFSWGNHHNAIGNKVVDKIVIIPKQAENSGRKMTAALVFKDA